MKHPKRACTGLSPRVSPTALKQNANVLLNSRRKAQAAGCVGDHDVAGAIIKVRSRLGNPLLFADQREVVVHLLPRERVAALRKGNRRTLLHKLLNILIVAANAADFVFTKRTRADARGTALAAQKLLECEPNQDAEEAAVAHAYMLLSYVAPEFVTPLNKLWAQTESLRSSSKGGIWLGEGKHDAPTKRGVWPRALELLMRGVKVCGPYLGVGGGVVRFAGSGCD